MTLAMAVAFLTEVVVIKLLPLLESLFRLSNTHERASKSFLSKCYIIRVEGGSPLLNKFFLDSDALPSDNDVQSRHS